MAFYDEIAAIANELLSPEVFGENVLIVRPTRTPADPDEPWNTVLTEQIGAATAAGFDEILTDTGESPTTVDDQLIYVAPNAEIAPSQGDVIRRLTVPGDWPVVSSKPLRPAGIACLFEVRVRRAG